MMIANLSNYLFQVLMSRLLGPASYSLLGSLLSFVTVLGISLTGLQTAAAKSLASGGGHHSAPHGSDPLTVAAIRYGVMGTLVVGSSSPLLARFLHDSIGPGLALAAYVIPAAVFSIGQGRLQGTQAFTVFSAVTVTVALGRILLSPVALALGLGISGVVMVTAIISLFGGIWGITATRSAGPVPISAVRNDVGRASAALVLFWLAVSMDVPVARHFLPADIAGQYAAASVLGKAVLWLPAALSTVMFPRVALRRQRGEHPHPPLVQATGLALGMCAFAAIILFVFGPSFIPIFFGPRYVTAGHIAWKVGAVCIPFALANLLVFYHLTRETITFLVAMAVTLIIEVAAFSHLHDSVDQIVATMGMGGIVLLVALGSPGIVRVARRSRSPAQRTGVKADEQ